MNEPASIIDVARAAGVSISTVSRVLNGTAQVNELKQKAVLEAVKELGYTPNANARSLKSGRSMLVGALVQDISGPHCGGVLGGVEQALEGSGYHLMFMSGRQHTETELIGLRNLLSRPVDALIIVGSKIPDKRLLGLAQRMPLVMIGRTVRGLEQACVRIDNVRGAHDAVTHLLKLGHRRVACIAGPQDQPDARDRLEGYCRAFEGAGLALDPQLVVEGGFTERTGVTAARELLARQVPFTALFASNDQMAYGASAVLHETGLQVPRDVSLVGFDDLPPSALMTPPLTAVRQPSWRMGELAANAVLAALARRPLPKMDFPPQLVVRQSTAPPAYTPG